jgi:hypothetical protein
LGVERKYERDVDLLLAEEFSVNPAFADWFRSKTKFVDRTAHVADVYVSKSNNLGESDLIVLYEVTDGERFSLLIEDKVDAPLQPDQAKRYRLRADKEVRDGVCTEYEVVLCAPRFYIDGRRDLEGFERLISLEEISEFLKKADPSPRGQYRAHFLATASIKRINTWKREEDQATDALWEAAYQLATHEFQILEMKRIPMTKNSTWIDLRPRDMPTQPKRVYVSLKGDRGQIDLTFAKTTAHEFAKRLQPLLAGDMTIHQTEASAAIRIEIQGFRISEGLDQCMPKVKKAFEASARLIEFYRKHRSLLNQAAAESTPL